MSTAVHPEPPPRPELRPAPKEEAIPAELRERPQWVVWRYEPRGERWTKVPYQPRDYKRKASADDPSTWATFNEAFAAYIAWDFDGIGFQFAKDDPYFGVDVDNCLKDGELLPWAKRILAIIEGTYGEISPSGNGIKFIARGKLPAETGTRRPGLGPDGTGALEVYDHGRYFAITGNAWDFSGIAEKQPAAEELYAIAKEKPARPASKPKARPAATARPDRRPPPAAASNGMHDDREVLRIGTDHVDGFDALYRGDLTGYPSPSEADLGLMNRLAFVCGPGQHDQVKRLFLGSRLGERDKAGREDYLDRTADKAYEGRSAYFDWCHRPNGRPGGNGPPPPKAPPGDGRSDSDGELAGLKRTDIGNGERLLARFGLDLRYCHPWSKWLVWDGRRWELDRTAAVHRKAKATARAILREAATLGDDGGVKQHVKWWQQSEGSQRLNAMLDRAATEEGIPILPDDMDGDGWLFNCANGTVDLRTGRLRPHRRGDLITQLCPLDFDPGAKCPLWEETLALFLADEELIGYWRRVCGYCLVGIIRDHVMPIAYGTGCNGKSTILGALLGAFGPDYAMKCPPDMLMARRTDAHSTDRTDLFRKRLVVAIETESGRRLNEAMVKELTGGDRIRARRMREDNWEFAPTHTLVMATNHKPVIFGTDGGIWRRLKLVPFGVSVAGPRDDKAMPDKLRAEYPGILAWCVRGCLEWQRVGLAEPEVVLDATGDYREEQDRVGAFLNEYIELDPGGQIKAGELYARYAEWAKAGNEFAITQTAFGTEMRERGFRVRKTMGCNWYRGIRLRGSSQGF
jgi:putative DNA primase/helicase